MRNEKHFCIQPLVKKNREQVASSPCCFYFPNLNLKVFHDGISVEFPKKDLLMKGHKWHIKILFKLNSHLTMKAMFFLLKLLGQEKLWLTITNWEIDSDTTVVIEIAAKLLNIAMKTSNKICNLQIFWHFHT